MKRCDAAPSGGEKGSKHKRRKTPFPNYPACDYGLCGVSCCCLCPWPSLPQEEACPGYASLFQAALFDLPVLHIPVIVKLRVPNLVHARLNLIAVKEEDGLVVQRQFK